MTEGEFTLKAYRETAKALAGDLPPERLRGLCRPMAENLASMFPELTLVRGHYLCPYWGPQQHWWCVTPCGEIIDPTGKQFPSKGAGEYEPWDDSQGEPTGKCSNCSGLILDDFNSTVCSEECMSEYAKHLMQGG